MKNLVKIVAMMAIVCVVALKAYNKQNEVQLSDVVLANVEALAEGEDGLPEVEITCSRSCGDGIGRCWTGIDGTIYCRFSGYQHNFCICN